MQFRSESLLQFDYMVTELWIGVDLDVFIGLGMLESLQVRHEITGQDAGGIEGYSSYPALL
jgi:hypothetical protein